MRATQSKDSIFTCTSMVNKGLISQFCRIVGNRSRLYTDIGQEEPLAAPMDLAIILCWKAVIKSLFTRDLDVDFLKLVHLSNQICMLDSKPLMSGDNLQVKAIIQTSLQTAMGKQVEVSAVAEREGAPILKVVSRFLFRGIQGPGEDFEVKEETRYGIEVKDEAILSLLRQKKWIRWQEEPNAGAKISFKLRTEKNKGQLKCVGQVLNLIESTKQHRVIGQVEYQGTQNHPLAFLQRHGTPMDQPSLFENDGYQIAKDVSEAGELSVTSAASNRSYASVSEDTNPIHTNRILADFIDLPGTITHGMWTSAAVRSLMEVYAADNDPLRLVDYTIKFVGMVLPGDRLDCKLRHIGMQRGRKLVQVEVLNQAGDRVAEGQAEIEQPRTAYIFTGQGSQEVGMGMDLYESSEVAKAIWDGADKHFLDNYGFSIIEIVRNNPKSKTVHFGGPKGRAILANYRSMLYERNRSDGSMEAIPLFPQLSEHSESYTFNSPQGLLYQTQFTQPALTLMEKAAFEDMRVRGLTSRQAAFAGHSLGEYSALASVGDVLPIQTLCDVVFYRGMTMQVAVKRDAKGRSPYGMVAANPTRVFPGFGQQGLAAVVKAIRESTAALLEIVNFNVADWQYVVAGDNIALDLLSNTLNYLHQNGKEIKASLAQSGMTELATKLAHIISELKGASETKRDKDGFLALERGIATIPLPGIDVPFHSSFLLNGVAAFRQCLLKKILPSFVDPKALHHKYIPNLTAKPFEVNRAYVEMTFKCCKSPVLAEILEKWNPAIDAEEEQRIAHALLVELLAYQFASPVRWIDTQDVLFKDFSIQRLIEIGPAPTLSGMAERTLKLKYEAHDNALNYRRNLWSYMKNRSEIYYEIEHDESVIPIDAPKLAPSEPTPVQKTEQQVAKPSKTIE